MPKALRSIVDYQTWFGGNLSYSAAMFRAAAVFFEEGGSELFVCRAVGTTPTIATLSMVDRTPTTPLPTLRIDAANPGSWGAGVTVSITAGTVPNSVTLQAWYAGDRVVYVRDKTSCLDIQTALSSDPYLRAADLGAISVYPTRLPALLPVTPLVGGSDDRATVTITKVVAALDLASVGMGAGAVAAPGYDAATAGALLIAHCVTHRRVAVLAGTATSAVTDLTTISSGLTTNGQFAGVFGPWVTVPEGSGFAQTSPEGYVLGVRARVMNTEGFWQAPAGSRATARYVLSAVTDFDSAAIDTLADGRANGLATFGADLMLYGWRSCSTNSEQYNLLNAQDVLNTLTETLEQTLQPYVFESIDGTGQLLSRVQGAVIGVMQPIADAGGITGQYDAAGNQTNPAYSVQVAVLNENTLSVTVAFRLAGSAETIQLSIVKVAFTATV